MTFFFEVLIGGLMAGLMYSLVAIGFVLIYKSSGVFNFAQGAMVLFSALTFVSLLAKGLPFWLSFVVTALVMVGVAWLTERYMLRNLVNRSPITLFIATLGLSYILEGSAQIVWGTQVHGLNLGISDLPIVVGGLYISQFELFSAAVAGTLVFLLYLLFNKTRTGIALRAVADDQLAALAVGIKLERLWLIVWSVAGIVGLIAGLLWGARVGVQFSLSLIVLKALPVLIIGGFTSIGGAIVGGLIIGVSEKLAEVYIGPIIGGGIENWFPYLLATVFLLFRPAGLFGEKTVERV
jgi:branched-chain amino acid transport system permease protein